jgi:hypothetical protein
MTVAIVADRANQLGHAKPLILTFDTTDSFGQLAKMLATHLVLTFVAIGPGPTLGQITGKLVLSARHPMPVKNRKSDTIPLTVTN